MSRYSYTPNNIHFRIVSSNAMAAFKNDQAFDFNELVNNPSSTFCVESREILLLNYEMWFRFILRMEKMFIRHKEQNKSINEGSEYLMLMALDTLNDINDVVSSHPSSFHSAHHVVVKNAFSVFENYIFSIIKDATKETIFIAYPKIVKAISNSLHNLLFILQEYECLNCLKNIKDDYCFLSYTAECVLIAEQIEQYPLYHRAIQYREHFGVSKFLIKNYSGTTIAPDCIRLLEEEGFKIVGVDNLNQTKLENLQ